MLLCIQPFLYISDYFLRISITILEELPKYIHSFMTLDTYYPVVFSMVCTNLKGLSFQLVTLLALVSSVFTLLKIQELKITHLCFKLYIALIINNAEHVQGFK